MKKIRLAICVALLAAFYAVSAGAEQGSTYGGNEHTEEQDASGEQSGGDTSSGGGNGEVSSGDTSSGDTSSGGGSGGASSGDTPSGGGTETGEASSGDTSSGGGTETGEDPSGDTPSGGGTETGEDPSGDTPSGGGTETGEAPSGDIPSEGDIATDTPSSGETLPEGDTGAEETTSGEATPGGDTSMGESSAPETETGEAETSEAETLPAEETLAASDLVKEKPRDGVVSLKVPDTIDFWMDQYGIKRGKQIHSQEYVIENSGNETIEVEFSDIKCTVADDIIPVAEDWSEEEVRDSEERVIKLTLCLDNGDIIGVTEQPASYQFVLEPEEKMVFKIGGVMSENIYNDWETGDVTIEIIYGAETWEESDDQDAVV